MDELFYPNNTRLRITNIYLQFPPHRGSLQRAKKIATYYDSAVCGLLYLVILQMLA
jgi:hypothetical protein